MRTWFLRAVEEKEGEPLPCWWSWVLYGTHWLKCCSWWLLAELLLNCKVWLIFVIPPACQQLPNKSFMCSV